MLSKQFLLSVFVAASLSYVLADEEELSRQKRAPLGVFSIIKFPNDPCEGSGNSKNGTCYTQDECENKGGTASGDCASGYGVCCIFSGGCGATYSENCTYFESSSVNSGECKFEVCRCNENICQLRLDFDQFVISGPSTVSASFGKTLAGNVMVGGTKSVSTATQCLTDTFTVTNPSGLQPSTICGTNTGEHMYVDASEACNDLAFQFGQSGIGISGVANRQWSIKVTQYACDYSNLAPEGCTQYFFGSNTDVVRTFNYQGDIHLSDQDQNICVRRERGNCRICWTATASEDFSISGTASGVTATKSACCGYGTAGASGSLFDCIIIPGAEKVTPTTTSTTGNLHDHFCGKSKGLVIATTATTKEHVTVCSNRLPFSVRFISDHVEVMTETTAIPNKGFQLAFTMTSSNCN